MPSWKKLIVSGSDAELRSVTSSFQGDGSGLTNVSATVPAGTVSSSAQTISHLNATNIVSSSTQLPSGIVSSSAQTLNNLNATNIVSSSTQTIANLNGSTILSGSVVFTANAVIANTSGISTGDYVCWLAPFSCSVIAVKSYRVGGTGGLVNARRNGTSEHLAADLSLVSAATWTDGGAIQNATYVQNDSLELRVKGVTGTITQLAIQINFNKL